jgi:hypothetical protein
VITAALQGQCHFAEGSSNTIAINIGALSKLAWHNEDVRGKVLQAAEKSNYTFDVFDLSTGYHTTIAKSGATRVADAKDSVANALRDECLAMMLKNVEP